MYRGLAKYCKQNINNQENKYRGSRSLQNCTEIIKEKKQIKNQIQKTDIACKDKKISLENKTKIIQVLIFNREESIF